ncbi:four helix bundle protein [Candidatus Curtissbacteria bacterium]|nr:four helix bundle protein [Candidatus Curtissbacteria bacterium]
MNENYKEELLNRLLKFSVRIIVLASKLPKTPAGYAIANQVIRAACSIGANCEEAQDAISPREFLHSMNISLKEARETRYWLRVILESKLISPHLVECELDECNQIVAILTSTVKSIKRKLSGK